MKKFSKITNTKVTEEPIIKEEKNDKEDSNLAIRYSLHMLIERLLHIKSYGPLDPMLQGNLKIDGEEEFISAIIDLFKEKEIQEQVKLLENSKYVGVDNMINNLNKTIRDKQTDLEIRSHRKRIKELFESSDEHSDIIELANQQADSISDYDKVYNRALVVERMIETEDLSKETLREVYNVFLKKSEELKNG